MLRATTACTFSTSQLPNMVCFVHFDFEMCFAPQRRALFRHRNFQNWSEHGVFFVHFDFEMCFAPQRCAIFQLIWPAGFAPAALASLLFDPWKNAVFRDFPYLFAHLDLLSSETFSFVIFFLLLFSSLTLPICFSSVHIVGSLTSKLPSLIFSFIV